MSRTHVIDNPVSRMINQSCLSVHHSCLTWSCQWSANHVSYSSNQAVVSLIVSHNQPIMSVCSVSLTWSTDHVSQSHMVIQSCLSYSQVTNQIKSFILITWFLHFPQIVCWRESSLLVFFPNSFKVNHLL